MIKIFEILVDEFKKQNFCGVKINQINGNIEILKKKKMIKQIIYICMLKSNNNIYVNKIYYAR